MSDWTDSTIINALKILVRDRQHIVDIVRMVVYVGTALLLVDIYRRDRSDNRDPNWFWLTSVLGSWIVAIAGKLLLEFLEMDDTDQMRWQAIMSGVNSYCFLRSFEAMDDGGPIQRAYRGWRWKQQTAGVVIVLTLILAPYAGSDAASLTYGAACFSFLIIALYGYGLAWTFWRRGFVLAAGLCVITMGLQFWIELTYARRAVESDTWTNVLALNEPTMAFARRPEFDHDDAINIVCKLLFCCMFVAQATSWALERGEREARSLQQQLDQAQSKCATNDEPAPEPHRGEVEAGTQAAQPPVDSTPQQLDQAQSKCATNDEPAPEPQLSEVEADTQAVQPPVNPTPQNLGGGYNPQVLSTFIRMGRRGLDTYQKVAEKAGRGEKTIQRLVNNTHAGAKYEPKDIWFGSLLSVANVFKIPAEDVKSTFFTGPITPEPDNSGQQDTDSSGQDKYPD